MMELRECLVVPFGSDYVVIGGNMRLMALKELNYSEVPCKVLDVDTTPEKLRAYTQKDNISFGETNWDLIANEWNEDELKDWGVELPIWDVVEEPAAEEDNYTGEPPAEPVTVLGDLYELNEHRVMCGDSTDSDSVARMVADDKPFLQVLDPMFDVDYTTIAYSLTENIVIFGRGANAFPLVCLLVQAGYGYHNIVNLTPANGVAADRLPANTHELFHVLRTGGYFDHKEALPFCKTEGELRATSVLNHGRPTTGDNYFSYAKPLPEMLFCMAYCEKGGTVLDLFGGSGTTLIACEQTKRKALLQELDPRQVDVICKRWASYMTKNNKPYTVKRNGVDITGESWLTE